MRKAVVLIAAGISFLMGGSAYAFIPATLFDEVITPTVAYDQRHLIFDYSYKIGNSSSSQQSIESFGVGYISKGLGAIKSPSMWDGSPEFSDLTIVFWVSEDWDVSPIKPGRSMQGYSFQHQGLPSIRTYFAKSSYIYSPKDDREIDEIAAQEKTYYFNNCKQGKTVGPGPLPFTQPDQMVSYLSDVEKQAEGLGWITTRPHGEEAFDKTLAKLKDAISRRKYGRAGSMIRKLKEELREGTPKHINASGVALLGPNLDYLQTILPSKERDEKDDD